MCLFAFRYHSWLMGVTKIMDKIAKEDKGDFSQGSIPGAILRLALPMTFAQLIKITYSIVDRIYLGRLPGAEHLALTGVGLTFPILQIVMSVAALCGTGGGPLFAIARGKGDDKEAERIMNNAFSLLILLGVILTIVIIVFRKPLLYLFGASDETYPYASDYLSFYSLGTIFDMISLGMNPFINAQGFSRIGMSTIAIGAVANMTLDPIFIFALGMGVRGAGLATVVAQFLSALWVMRFLTGKKASLRLKFSSIRLKASRVRRMLSLGLAGFIMNLTSSLSLILSNVMLQKFGGDLYVGAMAIISSLREVVFMPVSGIGNGLTPVIGYNYGASLLSRVRHAIRFSTIVTIAYTAVVWAILMLLPGALIRIFSDEPALIEVGIPALRIYNALFIFMSLQMSAQSVFVGLGKSRHAIFFSLLRKVFIAAPLSVILPFIGFGSNGVFIAETVSHLFGGVACMLTMYIVVYRRSGTGELSR